MGGANTADHSRNIRRVSRRTLFYWVIDDVLTNSWIVYQMKTRKDALRRYHLAIVQELTCVKDYDFSRSKTWITNLSEFHDIERISAQNWRDDSFISEKTSKKKLDFDDVPAMCRWIFKWILTVVAGQVAKRR